MNYLEISRTLQMQDKGPSDCEWVLWVDLFNKFNPTTVVEVHYLFLTHEPSLMSSDVVTTHSAYTHHVLSSDITLQCLQTKFERTYLTSSWF